MGNRTLSIRGARENNLRGIDLELPLGCFVVFTGVSGSGKSSLALDTLHQEGQRRYLEALAAHSRPSGTGLRRPKVDQILGLPPTIALEQRAVTPSSRATVATQADVHPLLRILFARAGTQHCPSCDRPIVPHSHDEIVAAVMALPEGTRLTLQAPVRIGPGVLDEVARAGFSRVAVDGAVHRLEEIDRGALGEDTELRVVVDRIRIAADRRARVNDAVRTTARAGQGVVLAVLPDEELLFIDRPRCWHCDRALPALEPSLFSFFSATGQCPTCLGSGVHGETDGGPCTACAGTRLREEARAVRWEGRALSDVLGETVASLQPLVDRWPRTPVTDVVLGEVASRLEVLDRLGLGGLPLDRGLAVVSRGELQRLRLAAQVGARLSGVLYVLDEPAAGLGGQTVTAVISVIGDLCEAGNSVLAVAHHPGVVAAADLVVDFGPGPGRAGGQVQYRGSPAGLLHSEGTTGRWFSGRERLPAPPGRSPTDWVRVTGASSHNLADLDVALPLGVLAVLGGPSGSGKTALLDTFRSHLLVATGRVAPSLPPIRGIHGVEGVQRVIAVDAGGVARSPRSNAATYTGVWNVLRGLFAATTEAQVRGLEPRFFSLNVKGGRCEVCKGSGQQRVDLAWLPEVWLPCAVCDGRRFNDDVLEVRWKGRAADEILDLPVEVAHPFLAGHPQLEAPLRALVEVGLGYLPLGQPAHTLSGGEAQRLALARELARATRGTGEGTVYLLDDPTVGLHPADVAGLVSLFRRLIDEGATVWLATHDDQLAAAADYCVRLGPGAGADGGTLVS